MAFLPNKAGVVIITGSTIIITGASSGIGESLAKKLGPKGANVVLAARSLKKLERISNDIKKNGGSALAVETDLTQENDCENLINLTIQNFQTIDMLILNAGVSMWAPFEEIEDISFFNDIMNVNYMGSVYCVHAALPELKNQRARLCQLLLHKLLLVLHTTQDILHPNMRSMDF